MKVLHKSNGHILEMVFALNLECDLYLLFENYASNSGTNNLCHS